MSLIRVLVVDDHPLMREALRAAIDDESDMEVVGEAETGLEAISLARQLRPDVTVMDVILPDRNGLAATAEIVAENPEARILIITSSTDDAKVAAAVQAGALGYLLKAAKRRDLLEGIRIVSQGHMFLPPGVARNLMDGLSRGREPSKAASSQALTAREIQVLKLIGQGASNRDIAEALVLSENTVRAHVHHILRKLDLKNRNQAVLYALRTGLVKLPDAE